MWAVVEGFGAIRVNGREFEVTEPGAIELIHHDRHTRGELAFELTEGVAVYATCFTPGLAA